VVSLVPSDSETESESEEDTIANPVCTPSYCIVFLALNPFSQAFNPRPGFPLRKGQKYLGPFILNREKGVMIPAAINTYLREYQREGVQFFWDLYDEGRGGLLGDDMGLVCQISCFYSLL
jgi:SNF2 family DNA or RNA helicase